MAQELEKLFLQKVADMPPEVGYFVSNKPIVQTFNRSIIATEAYVFWMFIILLLC